MRCPGSKLVLEACPAGLACLAGDNKDAMRSCLSVQTRRFPSLLQSMLPLADAFVHRRPGHSDPTGSPPRHAVGQLGARSQQIPDDASSSHRKHSSVVVHPTLVPTFSSVANESNDAAHAAAVRKYSSSGCNGALLYLAQRCRW